MVSFQCEACGDVFTKKKLDPHRGQCRGASFTCLDCMVHFQGTQYRSHTACMTESQKYEGALYKPKAQKSKKQKSVTIAGDATEKPNSSSLVPRNAYVEDAPDADDPRYSNYPPPPAPSPPPVTPAGANSTTVATTTQKSVDVFDFLVPGGDTPNASKVSVGGSNEQMKMKTHAPSVFDAPKALARFEDGKSDDGNGYDVAYEENGFSYGAGPIPPALDHKQVSNGSMELMTPANRREKDRRPRRDNAPALEHSGTNSLTGTSDKKRKRGHKADVNNPAPTPSRFEDTPMMDVPSSVLGNAPTPVLNHSGLTGGLNRMMRSGYSPSPEYSDYRSDNGYENTNAVSPIKRTRRSDNKIKNGENGLGISIKSRSGKIMSMLGGTGVTTTMGSGNDPSSKALARTRRHDSDEVVSTSQEAHVKKQKRHKTRQASDTVSAHKSKRATRDLSGSDDEKQPRRIKAIEYHREKRRSDSDERSGSPRVSSRHHKNANPADDNQVVIYRQDSREDDEDQEELRRERAFQFLSLINKGPESERGCSVHKTLKRFHRLEASPMGSQEDRDSKQDHKGRGRGRSRAGDKGRKDEEEQELWRSLRLKRNDRGELVVFV